MMRKMAFLYLEEIIGLKRMNIQKKEIDAHQEEIELQVQWGHLLVCLNTLEAWLDLSQHVLVDQRVK
jgi:methyl coenzyme M reductase subunit D